MAAATTAAAPPALTAAAAGRTPPPPPPPPPPPAHADEQQQQEDPPPRNNWHATYEDYLDAFLTADDAFFFDGDLDTARALVEAGLRTRRADPAAGAATGGTTALSRRAWTLARRRALRRLDPGAAAACGGADIGLPPPPLAAGPTRPCPPPLLLPSDPPRLPERECPLLALLARRERAVREGSLAVVVFLRARNAAGHEVSAYVDLAARLVGEGGAGRREGDEEEQEEEQGRHGDDAEEDDEDDEDDGDEDAAERRAAAADRRARDASRGMAGVFARVRPFLPLPTDLCYYNHATRRARANPTAQWQVAPAFADDDDDDGEEEGGVGGGRLLLRHVRDRRVLDVGAPLMLGGDCDASSAGRTVVDLSPLPVSADGGGGSGGGRGGGLAASLLSERSYLRQAVVFDHVVRRR
jgi:hypothetical protein